MSSRKLPRRKKETVVVNLVDPKGFPANCDDIQALLKEKVCQLSPEAQQELKALLPPCDQGEEDLITALNNNPIFWSSLQDWHELLKSGHLKPPKKTLSDKDLKQIPYKDDNFESFWGERMIKQKLPTEPAKPAKATKPAKAKPVKAVKAATPENPGKKPQGRGRPRKTKRPALVESTSSEQSD